MRAAASKEASSAYRKRIQTEQAKKAGRSQLVAAFKR